MGKFVDLGLTYEEAMHGVQTGVAYEMGLPGEWERSTEPKHLRTGVNSALANCAALAQLMMDKGVFTPEEYVEYLRLAANDELARYERLHGGIHFR